MSYSAIISKLEDVRVHPNADRLMLANVLGYQVVVGLDAKTGDVGIYFPSGGQLSVDYATANDLVRRKDANGDNAGGMFCEKRRVRIQKLRKEISDGYFAPISSISGIEKEAVGFEFTSYHGVEVCDKYIVKPKEGYINRKGSELDMRWRYLPRWLRIKLRKVVPLKVKNRCKTFLPHFDTSQLQRKLGELTEGDCIIITEKIHGTSARVGNLPVQVSHNWFKRKFSKLLGLNIQTVEYRILVGSRRVTLGEYKNLNDDHFRKRGISDFAEKLNKGETIYGELVGWEHVGRTIMPSVDKKKLGKKFKKYLNSEGKDLMNYSYGCEAGQVKHVVYRITQLNSEGDTVELNWEEVIARCAELKIDHVVEHNNSGFEFNGDTEDFLKYCDGIRDGVSEHDDSHIKEGIVIRVENDAGMFCLKHKSIDFKLLEGMLADVGVVDQEDLN